MIRFLLIALLVLLIVFIGKKLMVNTNIVVVEHTQTKKLTFDNYVIIFILVVCFGCGMGVFVGDVIDTPKQQSQPTQAIENEQPFSQADYIIDKRINDAYKQCNKKLDSTEVYEFKIVNVDDYNKIALYAFTCDKVEK